MANSSWFATSYRLCTMNLSKFAAKVRLSKALKFIKKLYFSTMQAPDCLNCENPLHSDHRFCPSCGQKSAVHRLSLHDVGHDAIHYFTHADKGIFSLLGQLVSKPGMVQREYVAGKRKSYFPPLNFFLLVGAIYVFMINIVAPATRDAVISKQDQARYERIPDPKVKAQVAGILERRVKSSQFTNKYSNIIAMIATPLISFFLWLFYYRGKYNYTEHLVANMYISGFTVLCFALVFAPLNRLFHLEGFSAVLGSYFLFEIAYRSVSYYYFFNKRTAGAAVKAALVSTAVIIIWGSISFALIYLYISNGFFGLLH